MDGLLILAEAPYPDQYLAIDEELFKLQQAFSLLDRKIKGRNVTIPVAILINKWDRRSPLEYHKPENEYLEMEEFLNEIPSPPHKFFSTK